MNNRSLAVGRCFKSVSVNPSLTRQVRMIPFLFAPLISGSLDQCNFKTCESGRAEELSQQTAGVRFFPLFFSSMQKAKQATRRRFWNANVRLLVRFRVVRTTPVSDSETLNDFHRPDHLTRSNLNSLLSAETLAFKSVLAGSMYLEGIINFSTGGVTPSAGGVLFTGPVTVTR